MQCQLNLLCYSIYKKNILAVSLSSDLLLMPYIKLCDIEYNTSIKELLSLLYNEHINLDMSWHVPSLIDNAIITNVQNNNLEFHTIYGCHIPYGTQLKNKASYVDVTELLPTSPILQKALNK